MSLERKATLLVHPEYVDTHHGLCGLCGEPFPYGALEFEDYVYGNCIYGCDRCGEVVLCLDTAFIDGGADGPSCMEVASSEHRTEAERRLRPGMLKSWANLAEPEAQVANELATEGCFLVGLVQMKYVIPSPYGRNIADGWDELDCAEQRDLLERHLREHRAPDSQRNGFHLSPPCLKLNEANEQTGRKLSRDDGLWYMGECTSCGKESIGMIYGD